MIDSDKGEIIYLLAWAVFIIVLLMPRKKRGGDLSSESIAYLIVQKHRKSRAK